MILDKSKKKKKKSAQTENLGKTVLFLCGGV